MNKYAEYLLTLEPDVLFAHGGCHVFALTLQREFGYPLLRIRGGTGGHHHIACSPDENVLLDVFGRFSFEQYKQDDGVKYRGVQFLSVTETELRKEFNLREGVGFYGDPDFIKQAEEMALIWINRYREYFDGRIKERIPDLSRRNKATKNELKKIFLTE